MDFTKLLEKQRQQIREHYERASPDERARIDEARREREADKARPRHRVLADRYCCFTGAKATSEIVLVVRPGHGGEPWVHVEKGGPTGYESIRLAGVDEAIAKGVGWEACFGTKGRYDRLVVPLESLRAFREAPGRAG